ncbi:MAG: hypothetical protein RIT81_27120 [Deltaproteobacteria bacterium]
MSHAKDYDAAARFAIPEALSALLRRLPRDETAEAKALIGQSRTVAVAKPKDGARSWIAIRATRR